MPYQPPVRDHIFLLRDVLEIEKYANLPGFADASMDVIEQIVEEAGRFTGEVLAPLNSVGDKEGCVWSADHTVKTPAGFKEAYAQLVEGGWPALGAEPAYGGQGLPHVVNLSFSEMSSSANMAFSMYPGLTHGAYSAILNGGSDAQKDLYLPKLASGQWGGTMNLTEPHCGTDLGLLRTKAVPQGDGSYKITGGKIWISGGEHDMAENIVHLVLARIEGAPQGTRGISLFIVPKFIPDAEGKPGARNSVYCDGLEEKMGIHGNATCVIRHEESVGWLVGEENRGLSLMFVMMNEARIGVGLQGIAQAEAAYQAAATFAKERLQGRSLTGPKNPDGPADPIIVHPDVRRMLMDSKALIEGGRAFLFWTALQGDLAHSSPDEAVRQKGADYMALMTPVVKGYLTDKGLQVCSNAVQVHGGSGFTEHFPVSQYMRDVRIALIYEGTNGVQALDLVGRKLAAEGGRAVMSFFAEIDAFVEANGDDKDLKPFTDGLAKAKGELQDATMWMMQNGLMNPDNAGAASTDYMHLFGLTALAYMWAQIAKTVQGKIAAGESDPFYANKLVVGRYYIERILPETGAHLAKLKTGSELMMALPAEAF
ncbi:acyl-CoA dehydrogenase [Phenylobacterium sp. Root77]|uniref:acyl-CoA dehydrogenase C-terminal domain-containing protein n=1 Tax=unclassified Phenylobacterium TaxID=2640670 RepID=UPI000701206E|nr:MULTISPECIES: acyl-CoA dehydrogenase C-terminal domain-containing protein [unclassified Phenylobacterium]KQW69265.1 acyl-CoA dehydrogenase [Phenylobacterium sp. Root1277]KQW95368.1 acyl-CoA dehydrogenase [Phenylobacterium sp. Root1290]KRC41159.1 acyl-CoA dehydrogenase [Phenylobacterium sp. Root77]